MCEMKGARAGPWAWSPRPGAFSVGGALVVSPQKGLESILLAQCNGMRLYNRAVLLSIKKKLHRENSGETRIRSSTWLPAPFH